MQKLAGKKAKKHRLRLRSVVLVVIACLRMAKGTLNFEVVNFKVPKTFSLQANQSYWELIDEIL